MTSDAFGVTRDEIRDTSAASGAVVLGIPEGPYLARASAEGLAHFQAVVRQLEAAGHVVRSMAAMADYDDIHRRHNALVAYEAARTHATWFPTYRELYHPKTAELIERGQAISDGDYRDALDGRGRLRDELHGLMDAHGIDAWITPADRPGAAGVRQHRRPGDGPAVDARRAAGALLAGRDGRRRLAIGIAGGGAVWGG